VKLIFPLVAFTFPVTFLVLVLPMAMGFIESGLPPAFHANAGVPEHDRGAPPGGWSWPTPRSRARAACWAGQHCAAYYNYES
jgi:hypothetical protein